MNIYVCKKVRMGFPGTISWRQENISVPYWRIYWNDAPGAFVKDSTGEIELDPGLVAAIPPRTVYSTRTRSGSSHFYVHFSADDPYSSVKPGIITFTSERLLSLASSISAEIIEGVPVNAKTLLRVKIYLCEMLLAIPDSALPSQRIPDSRVEAALSMMDSFPGISIAELASRLKMSRTLFLDLFRHETGTPPQKLSRQKRLEKACMMLHFGDKTIKQIAEETGFCDRYHFSRVFKKAYKYTPAQFKKQIDAVKPQNLPEGR